MNSNSEMRAVNVAYANSRLWQGDGRKKIAHSSPSLPTPAHLCPLLLKQKSGKKKKEKILIECRFQQKLPN
jgi:hypothetical protein